MEWYIVAGLILAGFVAGFINTLAGSGSLLTLPMLMLAGLPADVANGTNRIGIFLQNIVAVGSFKQQKIFTFRQAMWLTVPAIVGSIIGAQLAVSLDENMMKNTIATLMVIMFFVILLKPSAWIKGQIGKAEAKPGIWQILIFFGVGVYGGFIQAGIGVFMLAALVLGAGHDLVKANAIKNFIVLIYTGFALAIFIWHGQVNFVFGLLLAIGNMAGAWIAARYAVQWGAGFVRYILLGVILLAALHLFGVFRWIAAALGY